MNNKGQVLVIFVIMLPVILLLLTFIVDLGLISIEKKKIDANILESIDYYLDNTSNRDVKIAMENMLNENLNDCNIEILEDDTKIVISVKENYKCLFKNILDSEIYVQYKINKETKKIIKG